MAALLRMYPKVWRAEYGAEFEDLLLGHKLSLQIAADVVAGGLWQRCRRAEPGVLCGLTMFGVIALGLVANLAGWPPSAFGGAVLQASAKTLPTVVVKPFGAELYLLVLAGCGWWVVARRRGTVAQAGASAAKISFLAGLPVMFVGALLWLGVLDLVVLAPGTVPPLTERGLTYIYYDAALEPPAPLAVVTAPLFALPLSWLWGIVGGKLGSWTLGIAR